MLPVWDPRCKICNKPLTKHEIFGGGICSHWRCRLRRLEDDLRDHRDEAARAVAEPAPERFPFAVIPHMDPRAMTVPIEKEEREELEQHLEERLVDIARDRADPPFDPTLAPHLTDTEALSTTEAQVSAGVCGACRGYCCTTGKVYNAYIDGESLRRISAERSTTPSAVVAEILSYLPELHVESSCLFHTQAGCALPRALRSTTCNSYVCTGLKEARERFEEGEGFVVIRHNNVIRRSAFVGPNGIRGYERPSEEEP